MRTILQDIYDKQIRGQKSLAILIDPDSSKLNRLEHTLKICRKHPVDYFFVGGSLLKEDQLDHCIQRIRANSQIPIILFPGSIYQLHPEANALLYLSLLSGRNPEYLIGKQVEASMKIASYSIEVISTAYLLIDGGSSNAAAYLSQTQPLPRNKTELVLATAMAAQLLNFHWIYLEAGSGARNPVPLETIRCLKNNIRLPILTGGGIRSAEQLGECYQAGADLVVVGTAAEERPEVLEEMVVTLREFNLKSADLT